MPYKDPVKRHDYGLAYQRGWHRRRKAAFFEGKQCEDCGSRYDLVLGAKGKGLRLLTGGINPWSIGRQSFEKLVAKHGVVRCRSCQARHQGQFRRDRRAA